ncbi:hypothetical protein FIA56_11890 [Testudinibacter sp. TR-2022]|uniref:Imm42 family immunity protein n=1 Tax=Testudinibacter sp. TR-2022 TaxID=2585029 RepID=UPI00111B671D|nr:Imm42 family immunity protein [Testudinibacter sp. TR-2022]TNH10880.1 hypothetical protein FIA56_11890 [Testudinibacter sp. TR-2022]
MIYGCPDIFAVYADEIQCWSNNTFREGIICFYFNNKPFPEDFYNYTSTLEVNIKDLKDSNLSKPNKNKELFGWRKLDLCIYFLKKRYPAHVFSSQEEYDKYPEDLYEIDDFSYSLDIDFLKRSRLVGFVISDGIVSRIILTRFLDGDSDLFNLQNLKDSDVSEVYIKNNELSNIINDIL